eukprot:sb/3474652/
MTTDLEIAVVEASGDQNFTCTAVADSTVSIMWKMTDLDNVETDITSSATAGSYNSTDSTLTSTLVMTGLRVDETSTIECYDSTIGISDTMMLYVVGMCTYNYLDQNAEFLRQPTRNRINIGHPLVSCPQNMSKYV